MREKRCPPRARCYIREEGGGGGVGVEPEPLAQLLGRVSKHQARPMCPLPDQTATKPQQAPFNEYKSNSR